VIVEAPEAVRAWLEKTANDQELQSVAQGLCFYAQYVLDRTRPESPAEVIEPEQGQNAPNMSWTGYGNVERPDKGHHALCECYECRSRTRVQRVDVWPFTVGDPATRAKGEPTAVIEYGGVRIFITHTFIARVASLTSLDPGSSYDDSFRVLGQALGEMNRRMWRSMGYCP